MNMSIKVYKKRIKRVPRKAIVLWLITGFLFVIFLWEICLPAYRKLDNTETRNISIEKVTLRKTLSHILIAGDMRLTITENGTYYYIDYSAYGKYSNIIETDLLSGKIKSVTVTLAGTRSLYDQLFNRYQVVEMKGDNAIYYNRDDFVKDLQSNRISAWTGFILFFLCWVVDTGCILIVYGIVVFRKAKK